MTDQTFRNRSPYRARAMDRNGFGWTPLVLSPFAWYDAHLGGSSTQITDRSTNARAAATFGATTASPLHLPYTGVPYVHLEAAGTGTNSISCTAPAGTASYSASPLGGGAATTGAAAEGAFAFTTAGDWTQLDLLDAGAVVLASFRAADASQTELTDAHAVVWAINRGTAGRKTVILSPAAGATRSVVLFGANDQMLVPQAAKPTFGTVGTGTILAVIRKWATFGTNDRVFDDRLNTASSSVGVVLRSGATTASDVVAVAGDGAQVSSTVSTGFTAGSRQMVGFTMSATQITCVVDASLAVPTNRPAGTITSGRDMWVGRSNAANPNEEFNDMEFEALLVFDRVLSASELALIAGYYDPLA